MFKKLGESGRELLILAVGVAAVFLFAKAVAGYLPDGGVGGLLKKGIRGV